jgi:hypothetical protein
MLLTKLNQHLKSNSSNNNNNNNLLSIDFLEKTIQDSENNINNNNNNNNSDNKLDQIKTITNIRRKLRNETINKKFTTLSNNDEFSILSQQLNDVYKLSYDQFQIQATLVPKNIKKYFLAAKFLMLPRDDSGCIISEDFLRVVRRSIDIETISLNILKFSLEIKGFITEKELERYVFRYISKYISI